MLQAVARYGSAGEGSSASAPAAGAQGLWLNGTEKWGIRTQQGQRPAQGENGTKPSHGAPNAHVRLQQPITVGWPIAWGTRAAGPLRDRRSGAREPALCGN